MNKKCITVALIGRPNVGKSTLMNCIVGEKISITTPKSQTTRDNVRGILNIAQTQIIFIDTPGIFDGKNKLSQRIVNNAYMGLAEANLICMLYDLKNGLEDEQNQQIIQSIKQHKKPCFAIINKRDVYKQEDLLKFIVELQKFDAFEEFFLISAIKSHGITNLVKKISERSVESDWIYQNDEITDQPIKFFAEEITREKLMVYLQQEIPYFLKVETEQWAEDEKTILIRQAIVVSRASHKNIVIGKGGSLIKRIGTSSRKELQGILEKHIRLELFVKVRENWIERL